MTPAARAVGAVVGVAAAAGAAAFAWGALIERNRFQVRQEIVPVLPPGASPVTVLHLSDLHMAPWQQAKQDWLARIGEMVAPDLVVTTGDLLGHADGLAGLRRAFAPFAALGTRGAFVHGSNDYFAPKPINWLQYFSGPSKQTREEVRLDTAALERFLADELGWHDLRHRAAGLSLPGSELSLFGVDDPHLGLDRLDLLPPPRESSGADGPIETRLALAHAPYRRVLDAFVDAGADVIFAGHTHGGQVRIPGLPALVTNCDLPREQASGLSTWTHGDRTAWLEVSAGVGTSIYAPVRFACPPEAVVLTLVSG